MSYSPIHIKKMDFTHFYPTSKISKGFLICTLPHGHWRLSQQQSTLNSAASQWKYICMFLLSLYSACSIYRYYNHFLFYECRYYLLFFEINKCCTFVFLNCCCRASSIKWLPGYSLNLWLRLLWFNREHLWMTGDFLF